MTSSKAEEVLENVKVHYQTFVINNVVAKEWYRVLQNYDFEDVMNKFVDHLTGNNHKDLPQVYQLVKDLQPADEKKKSEEIDNQIKVCCQLCERWMSINEYENHYGRCLDIDYLSRQSERIGKPTARSELSKLTQTQIQALIDKYPPSQNKEIGVFKI